MSRKFSFNPARCRVGSNARLPRLFRFVDGVRKTDGSRVSVPTKKLTRPQVSHPAIVVLTLGTTLTGAVLAWRRAGYIPLLPGPSACLCPDMRDLGPAA